MDAQKRKQEELDTEELIHTQGQLSLEDKETNILLLNIIGEIEGHECLSSSLKTTKYEHIFPQLAKLEYERQADGLLLLLNTVGGDVEAGLAIAEMIASLTMPTVSLVLGGSHSIGVPLAVASDYALIVPTATMMIHPVRLSGTVIGVRQSYDYFKMIQDRITSFVVSHSAISEKRLLELMMNTETLTKDVGSILVGEEAVKEGLIHEVGGIAEAVAHLKGIIRQKSDEK